LRYLITYKGNASQHHISLVQVKPEVSLQLRYSDSQTPEDSIFDIGTFQYTLLTHLLADFRNEILEEAISSEEERPPSPIFDFSPPKTIRNTPSRKEESDEELPPSQSVDEIDRKAYEEHLRKKKPPKTWLTPEYPNFSLLFTDHKSEFLSLGLEVPPQVCSIYRAKNDFIVAQIEPGKIM
jgi:hypothetical protein